MPRNYYSDEFKRDAVALVESGIAQNQVVRDLGISKTALQSWVRDARFQSHGLTPPKDPEERRDMSQALKRIRELEMVPISERPSDVDERVLPGHWEGDLIAGTQNRSAVATLVERSTRYVVLGHLPGDHGAESVRESLVRALHPLPEQLRRTLTWDQGAEMAEHKAFTVATGMDVCFCDPASPWQRGTNENTNGLLRQYLPKGADLRQFTLEQLAMIAEELNGRPRKSLGWDTPAERIAALLEPA